MEGSRIREAKGKDGEKNEEAREEAEVVKEKEETVSKEESDDEFPIRFCSRCICGLFADPTLQICPCAATPFSLRVLVLNQATHPGHAQFRR